MAVKNLNGHYISMDKSDDRYPLGRPDRLDRPAMPKPHRKVNESGTVRIDPDTGRFYTMIPDPPPEPFPVIVLDLLREPR